jgi:hypothetical protein
MIRVKGTRGVAQVVKHLPALQEQSPEFRKNQLCLGNSKPEDSHYRGLERGRGVICTTLPLLCVHMEVRKLKQVDSPPAAAPPPVVSCLLQITHPLARGTQPWG